MLIYNHEIYTLDAAVVYQEFVHTPLHHCNTAAPPIRQLYFAAVQHSVLNLKFTSLQCCNAVEYECNLTVTQNKEVL